jgi:hypothetical protein
MRFGIIITFRTSIILGVKHSTFILPVMNDFVCEGTENIRVMPVGDVNGYLLSPVVIVTSKTKRVIRIPFTVD